VRTLLEAESARLAAANAGPEDVARLREICRQGVAAMESDDIDGMVAANATLHRCVTELSGNKVLLDFATQVDRRVRWYYTPVARTRGKRSWQEHTRLINAIEKGDGDTAAHIMREHTDRTRHTYLDMQDREAEPEVVALPTRRRRGVPKS
jgi:DNA-binding GntR family transcriptional regulator